MKIADFRKNVLGISQEQFARLVNLKSKGYVSDIERLNACSPRIALEIERISDGAILAETISNAVAMVRGQAA